MGCRHCQFDKVRTVFGIHEEEEMEFGMELHLPVLSSYLLSCRRIGAVPRSRRCHRCGPEMVILIITMISLALHWH